MFIVVLGISEGNSIYQMALNTRNYISNLRERLKLVEHSFSVNLYVCVGGRHTRGGVRGGVSL